MAANYVDGVGLWYATPPGTVTVPTPAAVQPGDLGFLVVEYAEGTPPALTVPTGWAPLVPAITALNTSARTYVKRFAAGDPALTISGSGIDSVTVFWYRGAKATVQTGAVGIRSGSSRFTTAPAVTVTGPRTVLTIAGERTISAGAAENGPPTAATFGTRRLWNEGTTVLNASTGAASCYVSDTLATAAGTVGPNQLTYPDASGNAWAVLVALEDEVSTPAPGLPVHDGLGRPSSLYVTTAGGVTAPSAVHLLRRGFPTVAAALGKPGFTMAHRGGSASYPEMSLYAYTQAAIRGYGIMEVSLARTSDGVWFGLHDADLNRTSGTTGLPAASSMTWAQVQAQQITSGSGAPRPYMRLDEYVATYGRSHVTMYDPKYVTDTALRGALFDYLISEVGRERAIYKGFGHSLAQPQQARAYGLTSWGFFYEDGYASGALAQYASEWDLLGMDYTASAAAWSAVTSYGKPVIGHIAPNQAAYDVCISRGAIGVQVSGVATVAPVSWWTP